ncbi:MAG: CAP domain-containing protein [Ferruginibacter sp.]|nr:CAP domain-containing protein [Cytophagales bacterium]
MNFSRPLKASRLVGCLFFLLPAFLWAAPRSFAQTDTFPEWTADQLAAAHTAKGVAYLSEEEQRVIALTNLARTDGDRFARTYLAAYLREKKLPLSGYVRSLVTDLKKVKGLPMFQPNEKLGQSAAYHANETGKKGVTGHNSTDGTNFGERILRFLKPADGYRLAENCYYGSNQAMDVVIRLLIDEKVPDLGHRHNLLNPQLNLMGVAIRPHQSVYRHTCVQDFATLE